MKVLIRADSGFHLGVGHVMRCLTLAKALIARGHDVHFFMRKHRDFFSIQSMPSLFTYYIDAGVQELDLSKKSDYDLMLGENYYFDIKKISETRVRFDLAVVDHYSLDSRFEKELDAKKILVIDDLMNRSHFCNYLLDQNLSADVGEYRALCPSNTRFFIGPTYALVREEFQKCRVKKGLLIKRVKNILVFFGGSDISSECKKVVDAYTLCPSSYQLHVILSRTHKDYTELSKNNGIKLYSYIHDMAEFLVQMDVCFGAAGSSSWERATLGVPSFIISVADNQHIGISSLVASKGVFYVGNGFITTPLDWVNVFNKLDDLDYINDMSAHAYEICDGRGVSRLLDELSF